VVRCGDGPRGAHQAPDPSGPNSVPDTRPRRRSVPIRWEQPLPAEVLAVVSKDECQVVDVPLVSTAAAERSLGFGGGAGVCRPHNAP
jgi:hypothetical protein